ncbi:MAG: Fic family protein, partial [Gaiellales bacterium]
SPIGRLVPTEVYEGQRRISYQAFLPEPLPTSISLSSASWTAAVNAAAALARLDGAARRFPNPHLLVRPALVEEAVSTSALEGTYASMQDVFQAALFDLPDYSPSTVEVRNYVRAAEAGWRMVREMPLALRVLRETHNALMQGARGDYAEAGRFRNRQNWIGPRPGSSISDSFFVPPPGEEVERLMNDWESWVNSDRSGLPPVVQAALAHYQFETIHPFIDGNGRVGRLAVVLGLIVHGELETPLLNISPFLEEHRTDYVEHLRTLSATGNFDPWIEFFCSGIEVQSRRALAKAERLTQAREEIVSDLHRDHVRGVAIRIAEDLIGSPYVTPASASTLYEVTWEAANNAIARLVELGVLEEVTGRSYGRVFASERILSLLQAPVADSPTSA